VLETCSGFGMEEEVRARSGARLPWVLVKQILGHLEYYNDLVRMEGVCTEWRDSIRADGGLHKSVVLAPGTLYNKQLDSRLKGLDSMVSFSATQLQVTRNSEGRLAPNPVHAISKCTSLSFHRCEFVEFCFVVDATRAVLKQLTINSCPQLKSAFLNIPTLDSITLRDMEQLMFVIDGKALRSVVLSHSTLCSAWINSERNRMLQGLFNPVLNPETVRILDISWNAVPNPYPDALPDVYAGHREEPLYRFLAVFTNLEQLDISGLEWDTECGDLSDRSHLDFTFLRRLKRVYATDVDSLKRISLPSGVQYVNVQRSGGGHVKPVVLADSPDVQIVT